MRKVAGLSPELRASAGPQLTSRAQQGLYANFSHAVQLSALQMQLHKCGKNHNHDVAFAIENREKSAIIPKRIKDNNFIGI